MSCPYWGSKPEPFIPQRLIIPTTPLPPQECLISAIQIFPPFSQANSLPPLLASHKCVPHFNIPEPGYDTHFANAREPCTYGTSQLLLRTIPLQSRVHQLYIGNVISSMLPLLRYGNSQYVARSVQRLAMGQMVRSSIHGGRKSLYFFLNCGFSIPLCVRIVVYFIGPSLHNNVVQCLYYATNNRTTCFDPTGPSSGFKIMVLTKAHAVILHTGSTTFFLPESVQILTGAHPVSSNGRRDFPAAKADCAWG